MLFNQYDQLQNLYPEKTEWTIRVRAQCIWEGINRTTMEYRGHNIIFVDDSNCRIHAFVSAKLKDLFVPELKEGRIYSICNFHVRKYVGDEKSRAVRYENHIYFDNYTQMVHEADNITNIPPYAFDLFDFDEVYKFLKEGKFLIDVVGIIENKNVECVYSKEDKTKSHIKFRITDGRYHINVTFFNQFAEAFDQQLKLINSEPIVIIIASAKVNEHDGNTCLNNYPATRFYLNVEHYSVKQLKQSMLDLHVTLNTLGKEASTDNKLYTISEIKKFNAQYIQRKVKCQVTVKKVEEKNNWYDNVCTSCGDEVNIVHGRYKCEECKRNLPFPDKRFRLATVCKDVTGLFGIVFPDEEIQRLTGKNVFEIENDETQVGHGISFPPLLKSFENKEFIVTLLIEENNIHQSCNVYNAETIEEPTEMLGNHVPSETMNINTNPQTISLDIDATTKNNSDSPQTEMSSTKMKSRKMTQALPYEFDENVPVAKLKMLKKEKV